MDMDYSVVIVVGRERVKVEEFVRRINGNGINKIKIIEKLSLAGEAQWIECQPANQRVAGLILSQGTCLCCWPGPQ